MGPSFPNSYDVKTAKETQYPSGVSLAEGFCTVNGMTMPMVIRLRPTDRAYHLAPCGFYRPNAIAIMVEKCASLGFGGRAWSWPGYAVDRTPYGVIQHELGHHVDNHFSHPDRLFSQEIYTESGEAPMTGYRGKDSAADTFCREWFAEIFRVFVTNPDLCAKLRPKFFNALVTRGLKPAVEGAWHDVLTRHRAPDRILEQAGKKISSLVPERGELIV